MTNLKLSNKFRILAIISAVIIVAGMALGAVMHFVGGGFFNYSGEYASYKSVTVTYSAIDLNGADGNKDDVAAICADKFREAGVSPYESVSDIASVTNGCIVYKFRPSAGSDALRSAADKINAALGEKVQSVTDISPSYAEFTEEKAILGGERALSMACIALATIVAAHFIYSLIRFGLTAMCAALGIDLYNLALLASVLALCRAPVTSSVMAVAAVALIATIICSTLTFDRIKRNSKDADNAKLTAGEVVDLSASQTFKSNLAISAFGALVAVITLVAVSIGLLSITPLLASAVCTLAAYVACCAGVTLFLPAMYVKLHALCSKIKFKPSPKKGK